MYSLVEVTNLSGATREGFQLTNEFDLYIQEKTSGTDNQDIEVI